MRLFTDPNGPEMPERMPNPRPHILAVQPPLNGQQHEGGPVGWVRGFAVLRRYWVVAATFAGCVFLITLAATLLMTPVYESSATIEIDPRGTQPFSLDTRGDEGNYAEYLETQSKTLQSKQLALAIIHKLRLHENPTFTPGIQKQRGLTTLASDADTQLTPPEKSALATFTNGLKVRRDTSSRLITVSFASRDPRISAAVANGLVQEFIESGHRSQHDAIIESSNWLLRQLDDLRGRMEQSNRELMRFQDATGIVDIEGDKNTVAERMSELDRQLTQAQSDRIQLEASLVKTGANPDKLSQVRNNPVTQQLTTKLAEARTELTRAQVLYGKNHPTVKMLQSQVDQLQAELSREERENVSELQASFAATRRREQMLQAQVDNAAQKLNQLGRYNSLKKQAQADVELYNSLYARIKQAGIAAASNTNNVRIVDPARILEHPSRPNIPLNVALGFFAALFGGVMIAFVRGAFDNKIRTAEDLRSATGVSTVSILPVCSGGQCYPAIAPYLVRRLQRDRSINKLLLDRPGSIEAEAIRKLCTGIVLSHWKTLPQVLVVASALPGEGKTTIASNLTIALARRGPSCLVDGDLRNPSVAKDFALNARYGLGDVLSGPIEIERCISQVPDVPNLSILPAGTVSGNPGDILGRHSVNRLLGELRQRFQFIVFDSPPILAYADAMVLATVADGVVFVCRHGTSTRDEIARSMEMMSHIRAAPILATILNGAQYQPPDYRYYYATQR